MRATRKLVLLILAAVLAFPAAGLGGEPPVFAPYIESYGDGWIDWQEMAIYGIGRGSLQQHAGSHPMARRAARVVALRSILKIAAGIPFDDRRSLQDLGAGPLIIELEGLIHFTEHRRVLVETGPNLRYEVVLRAALTGIHGVTGRIVGALKERRLHWDKLPGKGRDAPEPDDAPWLVLDARSASGADGPAPALFPKIVTESGRIVYDLDRVDEKALKRRGMARYVTCAGAAQRLQSFRPSAARWLSRLLFPPPAAAQEAPPLKRRRQFIVKDVRKVSGLAKTNLVISEKDARSLQAEDASSRILEQCRVIVIVSSPVGGVEGTGPKPPPRIARAAPCRKS